MPEFRFDEATHTYWVDGERYPSVSEVIAPCVDLDGIPPGVLAAKAQLGKHVHTLAHLYCMGLFDRETLAYEEHSGYALAWVKFCDEHEPQWDVVEKPLYSTTRRLAGTPDRFGSILVDGLRVRATVDMKNVLELRPATGLQLSAYALLLGAPASRRFAVQLKPDGTYRLKEYDDETAIFISLLNVFHWRRKHGLAG